jgi:hypothetical protein
MRLQGSEIFLSEVQFTLMERFSLSCSCVSHGHPLSTLSVDDLMFRKASLDDISLSPGFRKTRDPQFRVACGDKVGYVCTEQVLRISKGGAWRTNVAWLSCSMAFDELLEISTRRFLEALVSLASEKNRMVSSMLKSRVGYVISRGFQLAKWCATCSGTLQLEFSYPAQ